MNIYGKQGSALDWFKSYLTNRTQGCLVNGSFCKICSLKCGVRQGTILDPLDVDVNSIQLNLNHDLGNLNKRFIFNKLTLNTAKTEFMLIGSRQKLSTLSSQPKLSIDTFPIEKITDVNSLGICIAENLRWQT